MSVRIDWAERDRAHLPELWHDHPHVEPLFATYSVAGIHTYVGLIPFRSTWARTFLGFSAGRRLPTPRSTRPCTTSTWSRENGAVACFTGTATLKPLRIAVRAPRIWRLGNGRVRVVVTPTVPARVRATVTVPDAAKTYRLRGVKAHVDHDRPIRLTLALPRRAQQAALRRHGRVLAHVEVGAESRGSTRVNRTIRFVLG